MTAALDRCTSLLPDKNIQAFFHIIGAGESNERLDDAAYRMCNAGPPLTTWAHPWYGQSTTQVGHSTAAGFAQFLGTSWKEASDALGLGNEFTPINQQLATIWTIDVKRRALAAVMAGNIALACQQLATEWVSLPGLGLARAQSIFTEYGGTLGATAQPVEEPQPQPQPAIPASTTPTGGTMGITALLSMFGPLILGMIPQVKNIVAPPEGSNANKNLDLAQLLITTIINAAGVAGTAQPATPTQPAQSAGPTAESQQMAQLAAAITAMQHDMDLQTKVRNAVLTEPKIVETLQVVEFGGGVEKAAERGAVAQVADKPFWYNPVVWVTVAMLPIMYMVTYQVLFTLAGPYMVSNGVPNTPLQPNPWFAVVGFDSNTRTGLINLIVGFVFGGVCGIWFGTTVAKRSDVSTTTTTQTTPSNDVTPQPSVAK